MLGGLNAAQLEAVTCPPGPLMILAAAGTGKTRVITYRIAHLIRHGSAPERILAVTFTNKAAREMRERAAALLQNVESRRSSQAAPHGVPLIGTFHAICARILREDIDQLGFRKSFAIADAGDQDALARQALRTSRIDPKDLSAREFLTRVGNWKNSGWRSADVAKLVADDWPDKDHCAARVYPTYEQTLRSAGTLDFDDLLLCAHELFVDHPDALEKHRGRFDHLLVDEYQDTNAIQYRLLHLLAREHRSICVVGDDDQSIYGWRGAEVANFASLERDFPGTRIVRLEENYRSCPRILELANRLIAFNSGRYEKQLRSTRPAAGEPRFTKFKDEVQEAEGVAIDMIRARAMHKLRWRDFAILFRTNEQPRLFEQALRTRDIPYTLVGGYSFFDRREIRDILGYLRAVQNPDDDSNLERILNVPARGLGTGAKEKLVSEAARRGVPLASMLPVMARDALLPGKFRAGLAQIHELLEDLRARSARGDLVSLVQHLLSRTQYEAHLARVYPEAKERLARWDSVKEFVNMVGQFAERRRDGTLQDFLDSVSLATQEDRKEKEDDKDAATLITLHAAKGLEFPHVYMVGVEDGILPHERSMETKEDREEERRLTYVGITRARDQLTLSRAEKRMRFGVSRPTRPSPFLAEMFGALKPVCREKESDQLASAES